MRGSAFGSLSDAGRAAMRAHGVRTVIDLRGADEVTERPSPYAVGTTYRCVTFLHGRTMGLHRAAAEGTLPAELGRLAEPGSGLREIVHQIAHATPGTLVHCLAGRDRTGIVVALVLAAIGVPEDQIVADYVASDAELADEYARFVAEYPEQRAEIAEAIERREWTMQQVLAALRAQHGDAAGYLRSAGVAPEDIELLRVRLVE